MRHSLLADNQDADQKGGEKSKDRYCIQILVCVLMCMCMCINVEWKESYIPQHRLQLKLPNKLEGPELGVDGFFSDPVNA